MRAAGPAAGSEDVFREGDVQIRPSPSREFSAADNLIIFFKPYEDIDWVFHEAKAALTPEEVEAIVAEMRHRSVKIRDTVAAPSPALTSPCDF